MTGGDGTTTCTRCGQPLKAGGAGLCGNCRGFDRTAGNSFGLLGSEVQAVDGGWRTAWIFDGGFEGWLCPHTHASPEEANSCPELASVLTGPKK